MNPVMKVEITCVGCGIESAISVGKMLPLCEACSKQAKTNARGVSRSRKTSPNPPTEPEAASKKD